MASAMVPLSDDTIPFGDEELYTQTKGTLTHPYVTFFHLFFRGASVVVYMMCGWFSDSFITSFVTVILFSSIDFWTVKNVTGRLMVGLRWWNYVDDDGKSHWVFKARKGLSQNRINYLEVNIFWTALVLTTLLWVVFFIMALLQFKLKWLLLVMIVLILNGANLYGYIRCKVGGSESLTSVTFNLLRQVLQNTVSMVTRQATAPVSNPMTPSSNTA